MKRKISKYPILATIFLLVGCSGGTASDDSFSYIPPGPFIPPVLNSEDYNFEKNDVLKNFIVSLGKNSGDTLTAAETNNVLTKVSANDMYINKVERVEINDNLYDRGANDVGGNIILDEGNYRIRKTETISRNDTLCTAEGDLTHFEEVFGKDTINASGIYSLSVDLDAILIKETREYDIDKLNKSNIDVFTVTKYSEYLNLAHNDVFVSKMQNDYNDTRFDNYIKTRNAVLGENGITISQTLIKTILNNGENLTYSLYYLIIVEDGVITRTEYNYQEKDQFDTVFREISEVEQYSHETL